VATNNEVDTRRLKRHSLARYPASAPVRLIVEALPSRMTAERFGSVAVAIIRAIEADRDRLYGAASLGEPMARPSTW
jgi:hypothetical protein